MADSYRKELVSPSGTTVVSTSERETNDLIFGLGYREAEPDHVPPAAGGTPADTKVKPPTSNPEETT